MTIGELVFWYSAIIIVLLLLFVVLLIRRKAGGKPIFAQADWRFLLGSPKGEGLSGEFWLKVSLAAFIGLCLGVIIALFVLPYGVPQGHRCVIADGGDACRPIAKVARVATDKKQPLMEGTFSRL